MEPLTYEQDKRGDLFVVTQDGYLASAINSPVIVFYYLGYDRDGVDEVGEYMVIIWELPPV